MKRLVGFLRRELKRAEAACDRGDRIPYHCGYSTGLLDVARRLTIKWKRDGGAFRER